MINNDVITMIANVDIVGTLGTTHYFLFKRQYQSIGEIYLNVQDKCSGCNKEIKKKHYIIDINGEHFYIDCDDAVIEGRIRSEEEQDIRKYIEQKPLPKPKDYNKVYFEVYGIDRAKSCQRVDNGYELWLRYIGDKG